MPYKPKHSLFNGFVKISRSYALVGINSRIILTLQIWSCKKWYLISLYLVLKLNMILYQVNCTSFFMLNGDLIKPKS